MLDSHLGGCCVSAKCEGVTIWRGPLQLWRGDGRDFFSVRGIGGGNAGAKCVGNARCLCCRGVLLPFYSCKNGASFLGWSMVVVVYFCRTAPSFFQIKSQACICNFMCVCARDISTQKGEKKSTSRVAWRSFKLPVHALHAKGRSLYFWVGR